MSFSMVLLLNILYRK